MKIEIPGTDIDLAMYELPDALEILKNYKIEDSTEWRYFHNRFKFSLTTKTHYYFKYYTFILNNCDWSFRWWVLESNYNSGIQHFIDKHSPTFPWYDEWQTTKAIMK